MNADWQAHIDALLSHVDALIHLGSDCIDKGIQYTKDDKTELMVLGYSSRQVLHLEAVQSLVTAGHHSDATLIARTMFEGAAQLTWALTSIPDRPDLWF